MIKKTKNKKPNAFSGKKQHCQHTYKQFNKEVKEFVIRYLHTGNLQFVQTKLSKQCMSGTTAHVHHLKKSRLNLHFSCPTLQGPN